MLFDIVLGILQRFFAKGQLIIAAYALGSLLFDGFKEWLDIAAMAEGMCKT